MRPRPANRRERRAANIRWCLRLTGHRECGGRNGRRGGWSVTYERPYSVVYVGTGDGPGQLRRYARALRLCGYSVMGDEGGSLVLLVDRPRWGRPIRPDGGEA